MKSLLISVLKLARWLLTLATVALVHVIGWLGNLCQRVHALIHKLEGA
jgi:hypothetical protein